MKHIGLFEGIGGFSLAARWMGWRTIAWCEWDEMCQRHLRYHFPEAEGFGDITQTDFTKYADTIDILTGGFPCQPFSQAGKRKGTADTRYLLPEMLRAIREIRPRWIVGENVRGLVNWDGGLVFDTVQADLEAQGYEVLPFLLPACAVNAPHRRDRIWFIAYANSSSTRPSGKSGSIESNWRVYHDEPKKRGKQTKFNTGRAEFLRFTTNTDSDKRCKGRLYEKECEKTERHNCTCNTRYGRTDWQDFPTQPPVCGRDDGLPTQLDGVTFSKWRQWSIKSYGNAVVPQVVYQIYKAIEQWEESQHTGTKFTAG